MPQTPNATHERTAATRLRSQTLHTTHARSTHGGRAAGRTTEGGTRRKDGAGIILRELSHGMLTLLALDRAHALSHHNSLVLCRSPPFLYRGISFMHFGFLRVLNDGAFANDRPTEPLHRQSGTTTKQARVLIRLLLTMFLFLRVWISFIPRKLPTRQPAYAPTCFPDVPLPSPQLGRRLYARGVRQAGVGAAPSASAFVQLPGFHFLPPRRTEGGGGGGLSANKEACGQLSSPDHPSYNDKWTRYGTRMTPIGDWRAFSGRSDRSKIVGGSRGAHNR